MMACTGIAAHIVKAWRNIALIALVAEALTLSPALAQSPNLSGLSGLTGTSNVKQGPAAKAGGLTGAAKPNPAAPKAAATSQTTAKGVQGTSKPVANTSAAKTANAAPKAKPTPVLAPKTQAGSPALPKAPPQLKSTATGAKAPAAPSSKSAAKWKKPNSQGTKNHKGGQPAKPHPVGAKATATKPHDALSKNPGKQVANDQKSPAKAEPTDKKSKASDTHKAGNSTKTSKESSSKVSKDSTNTQPTKAKKPGDGSIPKSNAKSNKAPLASEEKIDHFETDPDSEETSSPILLIVTLFAAICAGVYLHIKKRNQTAASSDLGASATTESDLFSSRSEATETPAAITSHSQEANPLESIVGPRKSSAASSNDSAGAKSDGKPPASLQQAPGQLIHASPSNERGRSPLATKTAEKAVEANAAADFQAKNTDFAPSSPVLEDRANRAADFSSTTRPPSHPGPSQDIKAEALEPIQGVSLETYAIIMACEGRLATQDPAAYNAIYADFGLDAKTFEKARQGWLMRMNDPSDPITAGKLIATYERYFAANTAQPPTVAAPLEAKSYSSLGNDRDSEKAEPCSFEQFVELMAAQECWQNQGKDIASELSKHFQMSVLDYSNISQFWSQKYIANAILKRRYDELEPKFKQKWGAA